MALRVARGSLYPCRRVLYQRSFANNRGTRSGMFHVKYVLLLLSSLSSVTAVTTASQANLRMHAKTTLSAPNPMRRVIKMMEVLRKKAKEKQKEDDDLWEEIKCKYIPMIKKQTELVERLGAGLPGLQMKIEELTVEVEILKKSIKQTYSKKESSESFLYEANKIRDKESVENTKQIARMTQNIEVMDTMMTKIYEGLGQSFLQTNTNSANVLWNIIANSDQLTDRTRARMAAFIQNGGSQESEDPATTSNEIVGVLKQMSDTMKVERQEIIDKEKEAEVSHVKIKQTSESSIEHYRLEITEEKIKYSRQSREKLTKEVEYDELLNGGYRKAKAALEEMKADFTRLSTDYEKRTAERAQEILALTRAIQTLNSDPALAVFKRTLPSPSFLQEQWSHKELTNRARSILQHRKGNRDYRIDLIALSMHAGKGVDFKNILKKVGDMIKLLGKEQESDDMKRKTCNEELYDAKRTRRSLRSAIAEQTGSVGVARTDLDMSKEMLAETKKEIYDLDYEVVEAGEQRKKENTLFEKTSGDEGDNNKALHLLRMAKSHLAEFYLKEPAAAALVQGSHANPATNVLSIIDGLTVELGRVIQDDKSEEQKNQFQYGVFMETAKEERISLVKREEQLEQEKADGEEMLTMAESALRASTQQAVANNQTIIILHSDCDWLLKNYESRKDARITEINSLKSAQLVLRGGDVSLLQEGQVHHGHELLLGP